MLKIPPLRENKNNIAEISKYYWKKLSNNTIKLKDKEIEILCDYNYPGNIRELGAILECVWLKSSNNNDLNKIEIIKSAIDSSTFRADGNNEIKSQDIIALCIERMRKGESFRDEVCQRLLHYEINKRQVKEITRICYEHSGYDSKELMKIINMPQADYKKVLNFLNGLGINLTKLKPRNSR